MNDTADSAAQALSAQLVGLAGGYLRNTLSLDGITCAVCTTPTPAGTKVCNVCRGHTASGLQVADHVGILTYAIAGKQSGYLMRGYKAPQPIKEHFQVVQLLFSLGLYYHYDCIRRISGSPITHWTTVPSLPAKARPHPLRAIASPMLDSVPEIQLTAAQHAADPRAFREGHFTPTEPLPKDAHVLVIEDTWVSGGHVQSAGYSLRKAGAAKVSILVIARWLREDYGDNANFISKRLTNDFNPRICPWTRRDCP